MRPISEVQPDSRALFVCRGGVIMIADLFFARPPPPL
eukprot:COSAG01_NODE_45188_length_411_cov_3.919872_1_plen_36_part_01